MLKRVLKNEKGLTLIELLAVIVILGIIAAIAIPAIGNIIQNSKEDGVKSDAIAILEGAKLYQIENPDQTGTAVDVDDLSEYVELTDTKLADATIDFSGDVLTITGSAEAGKVTIEFTDATIKQINDDESGDGINAIPNPSAVTP
ncbi:type IV pilus assembly protein PilA [Salirhabdus euzebyi]|uniref:Type IV pilus assembly protein PilA n=1 Tax=Salirhabdus euzebyi TaxID=394506 RepID=A0A841Q9Z2_9BACI|nr:prepilin-type N-terminal cleavage/methylation domain-containing protein [Salirhabdus euzebyi]MBB6455057.1 type IV pilus assembly protein PilA [Salirhabdus euzebyi]